MGTVTSTSTPFSGSFENLGGGELLRKTGGWSYFEAHLQWRDAIIEPSYTGCQT